MPRQTATMRDVAERAGVSVATVSNVLGNRRPVDALLAERVRQAAASLDYQIDRAASQLRSGRARIVCMLVPSLDNPFFIGVIAGIERAVRSDGYDIVIAASNDDEALERTRLAALLSWKPAGVIVIPSTDAFRARDLLDLSRTPYVIVDRAPEDNNGDVVTIDNAGAAALAARHLLDLGHERPLVVASSLELGNIRERCTGIVGAYKAAGFAAPDMLEVGLSFDEIGQRIEDWLGRNGRPSGVIALTNFATMGVISAFKVRGVFVPDDVSLVGFDDYTWMQVSTPSVTAVVQPIAAIAAAAWERLSTRIDGAGHPTDVVRLGCRLEIRQSTKAVGPPLRHRSAAGITGLEEAR